MTLAANSISAAFSPFTAPMLLLPLPAAFLGVAVAKLALAMAGTWLWACELGASRRASVLAGVAFGLSLTFSQWLFCPQTSVFCLWPWMLFFVECGRDPAIRRRARAALAATFVVQALAGHPESLALGVLFALLWIVLRWVLRDLDAGGRVLADFLAAGAAAAALTAFLLLPSALAILASNRLVNAEIPHWTPLLSIMPHGPQWGGIVTAVFPHALGDLVHEKIIAGATGAIPEMDLGFFGLVGWAAVLLVLRPGSRRPRTEWALLALLVCGLGVAVALWPFGEVFAFVPALRNMFPLRFASWVPLAGSVAAAFEVDRLAKDARERPRAVAVAAALTLAFAGFAYGLYKARWLEHQAVGGVPFQRTETIVALAVLFAAALCWIAMRRHAGAAMAAVAVLAAADLLGHWHHIYRPSPTTLLYPETPMIRFLRSREGVFRVAGQGGALFQNSGVFAGVEDVRTNDGVERRDYVVFLNATCGYPPEDYFKHIRNVDAPVLDFLNVRYMVSPPDGKAPGTRWTSVYEGHDGSRLRERRRVAAGIRSVEGSARRRFTRPPRAGSRRRCRVRRVLRRDCCGEQLARAGLGPRGPRRRCPGRRRRGRPLRRDDQRDRLPGARDVGAGVRGPERRPGRRLVRARRPRRGARGAARERTVHGRRVAAGRAGRDADVSTAGIPHRLGGLSRGGRRARRPRFGGESRTGQLGRGVAMITVWKVPARTRALSSRSSSVRTASSNTAADGPPGWSGRRRLG